jgi:predicted metal-dependent HD superfamily phosphohydrolase
MTQPAPWAVEQARAGWLAHIAALAPAASASLHEAEGQLVMRAWTEPHRAYHSLQHVAEMLAAIDEVTGRTAHLPPRELACARVAVWYHDLAYDPRAMPGSNEHRSASLARDHLHRLGCEDADVDLVEALVLMTVEHDPQSRGLVGQDQAPEVMDVFHDADLWILSAPPQRYEQYARQVRQEYQHVPRELFAHGRCQVLRRFAEREALYRTEHAQRCWTASAHRNLTGELAALSGG